MFKRSCKILGTMGVAMALFATSHVSAADYTPLTLNFDDLNTNTGAGLPLATYSGFTFDAGTFYTTTTVNSSGVSSNYLITNNALTIRRSDNKAFYFDSVDHAMRGGETREYFFVFNFADGTSFSGANLNAADNGNFRNSDGTTELSGTDKLISSFSVVGKQTETADYSYLALDNFQFRVEQAVVTTPVPEPEIYAMMLAGLGLMGWVRRRRSNRNTQA